MTEGTESPTAEERIAKAQSLLDAVEANPVGWGGDMAVSLARTIRRVLEGEQ